MSDVRRHVPTAWRFVHGAATLEGFTLISTCLISSLYPPIVLTSRVIRYDGGMEPDHVDTIIAQWNEERPDIDVSGMQIVGRISRLERTIRPRLNALFAKHGLESWEFDVLATLRRSGSPYRLSAGELLRSMMITSGTMTNRIDRLEERGFLQRVDHPSDRRVVLVELTEDGMSKIDEALPAHAANEKEILQALTTSEYRSLVKLLRRLHQSVDIDEH